VSGNDAGGDYREKIKKMKERVANLVVMTAIGTFLGNAIQALFRNAFEGKTILWQASMAAAGILIALLFLYINWKIDEKHEKEHEMIRKDGYGTRQRNTRRRKKTTRE